MSFVENIEKHFKARESGLTKSISARKRQALDAFKAASLPTRRDENWRYTPVNFLNNITLSQDLAPKPNASDIETIKKTFMANCHPLVFFNGCFQAELSSLPKAITFKPGRAFPLSDKLFYLNDEKHPFYYLNAAMADGDKVLTVTKNYIAKKPIQLIFAYSSQQPSIFYKQQIKVNKNSEVTFFEQHLSLGDEPSFINASHEIFVDENATLNHIKLQTINDNSHCLASTHLIQKDYAQYRYHHIGIGAKLSRDEIYCQLQGEDSSIVLNGINLIKDHQLHDNFSTIYHQAPHTQSNTLYKGVAKDKSNLVFSGKVVVYDKAVKVLSAQRNDNILLSPQAEANSKPILQIFCDDVKCSHGATVGQIDEQALFYLQARGIDNQTAKKMLLMGFVNDIIASIKPPQINSLIKQHCQAQLTQLFEGTN